MLGDSAVYPGMDAFHVKKKTTLDITSTSQKKAEGVIPLPFLL